MLFSFHISCRFLRMWYFKILFLNFQHSLFLRDPFMSLLKLRTFGYTSPHGAGCSNPKNIGWMNSICNSQKQNNVEEKIAFWIFLVLNSLRAELFTKTFPN